jgi:hypothetical protein
VLIEVPHHDRDCNSSKKDLIVVEPEPPGDEIQTRIDVLYGAIECGLDLGTRLLMKVLELLAGGDGGTPGILTCFSADTCQKALLGSVLYRTTASPTVPALSSTRIKCRFRLKDAFGYLHALPL